MTSIKLRLFSSDSTTAQYASAEKTLLSDFRGRFAGALDGANERRLKEKRE